MQSSRVPSTVNFTTISPLHSLRRLKTLMLSNMSPIISNLRQRLFYSRPYFIPIVHPSRLYPSRWYVRPDHVQLTDRSHIYYISGTEEPAAAVHFISSPSHPRVPLSLLRQYAPIPHRRRAVSAPAQHFWGLKCRPDLSECSPLAPHPFLPRNRLIFGLFLQFVWWCSSMSASEILQGMVGSTTIRNSWLYWIRCVQSLGLELGEWLLLAPLSLSLPHDCDWILTGFFPTCCSLFWWSSSISAAGILQRTIGSATISNSWLYWIWCGESMLELGERLPPAPLSFSLSLFAIMTGIDLILVLILLVFW